jgi:hypothetical protein
MLLPTFEPLTCGQATGSVTILPWIQFGAGAKGGNESRRLRITACLSLKFYVLD